MTYLSLTAQREYMSWILNWAKLNSELKYLGKNTFIKLNMLRGL